MGCEGQSIVGLHNSTQLNSTQIEALRLILEDGAGSMMAPELHLGQRPAISITDHVQKEVTPLF